MEEQIFIVQDVLPIDTPNRNGRIYSRSCVEKMIADFKARTDTDHPLFGELDQPSLLSDATQINIDRVSHSIEDMYIEGDMLMTKVKILGTPMGNILKTLNSDVPDHLSLQLRGVGSLHEETNYVNDYKMVTIDIGAMATATSSSVDKFTEIMDSMVKDGLI